MGIQYLGVNGLLTNVLAMLALVEGGVGSSIVFYLYRALATNNQYKIKALIRLYKKTYILLSIIITFLGIMLYPFLHYFLKSESMPHIGVVYFLFIASNIVGYLNAHKVALIYADQKGYILTRINFLFSLFSMISKIVILLVTKSYIFYLAFDLLIFIVQNLCNGRLINNRYTFLKTKETTKISEEEQKGIIRNVKALFLHNLGSYIVFGTDNLLISYFIGVKTVGIYSNYIMIINQLSAFMTPILGSMGASIGNLIATEDENKTYSIFKVTYFVNFWVYSVATVFLFNLLDPFISWWLGKQFLLDQTTFYLILFNFYLTGLRGSISAFKDKSGVFLQDRYVPLIEGAINLVASIILVKDMGLSGIFLGTTISTLVTVFWVVPYLTYKHVFKRSSLSYYLTYSFYTILSIISIFLTKLICQHCVKGSDFFTLIEKGIISLIIPSVLYLFLFFKSDEFKYLARIFIGLLHKVNVKRIKLVKSNHF
ncbi:hypothetical protein PU629_15225 [Pullulanibacillus sp. KACC 23026]|uniref:lipopolysaccharide biosynthesis protein n=1 Tax=Pullulanibacillus sp. KACC 23026 TaxID=3028315 RepID=UPI0023AF21F9|nr:hypothetical protein [Pullulanibacillus sp. KACC 23026]WEG11499.1 hypothetical protein PU629_15225 [Pullulanibacillus sp. KACC 23026]